MILRHFSGNLSPLSKNALVSSIRMFFCTLYSSRMMVPSLGESSPTALTGSPMARCNVPCKVNHKRGFFRIVFKVILYVLCINVCHFGQSHKLTRARENMIHITRNLNLFLPTKHQIHQLVFKLAKSFFLLLFSFFFLPLTSLASQLSSVCVVFNSREFLRVTQRLLTISLPLVTLGDG